jgi:hypothetical protein
VQVHNLKEIMMKNEAEFARECLIFAVGQPPHLQEGARWKHVFVLDRPVSR